MEKSNFVSDLSDKRRKISDSPIPDDRDDEQ